MKSINITNFFLLAFLFIPAYSYGEAMISPTISENTQENTVSQPAQTDEDSNPEKTFQRHIHSRPDLSARKFLEIMSTTPTTDEKEKFIRHHFPHLINLLIELERRGHENEREEVVAELEKNNFGITARIHPTQRTQGKSRRKIDDNPINQMIEIRASASDEPAPQVEEKLKKLSEKNSSESSVQTAIAEYYNEIKNFKEAENYSTKAIELDNTNLDAYKIRAFAKYSMNDVKGAIEDIQKASEIDPQDETSKLLNAIIKSKKNISLDELSTIQELKNVLKDLNKNSLEMTIESKNNEDTIEHLKNYGDKLINIDYTKSQFYLKTAATKNQMQDYEGAIKYATLAIEKNPNNLEAYLERANSYNFLGKYDEAIRDTTFILGKEPENIHALNIRAWALYKKGMLDKAGQDTSKALEIKPDFADAMFNRALTYEKQGKYEEMLSDLEKAAALSPLYRTKFHDAVAQYANKIPNFSKNYKQVIKQQTEESQKTSKPLPYKRFLTILLFTLTGGLLIGFGMLHIFSDKKNTVSRITHPDTISPSIFYEGVATGKYKILKKIGQGGMGIIYLAIDQTLNREVAIKKMNDEIKFNQREKQRFIEEARTVAMLHHPNIVEIYTIFEEENDIYLVFEYIDGVTLDKKLNQEVRMPFEEVQEIANEIGKALIYAHNKNIIHRDMKLSNVMISKEGLIKVMDFGLARIARQTMARISSPEVVGSPAYMAPEQDNGISLKESDIYSFGICIYEMLAGELPFNGPDYHYQKEKKMFAPLTQIVPGLNSKIDDIISKTLDPIPENRYHCIEDFLLDLNSIH